MLTVMIHAKIRKALLNEYLDMIKLLTETTTKQGCLAYSFNQSVEEPTEFVIYEQWESQEAFENHIKELFDILGPAKDGEPIPDKLMRLYEKATPVFYNVVSQNTS